MKRLTLLLFLFTVVLNAHAQEQVYFKIAVNENDYSTFLTDRTSIRQKTLQYLASKMQQTLFCYECINQDFYSIKESGGMTYFDRTVVQYDLLPKNGDRFRHVLMVDQSNGAVIRKEVYDIKGKLVYSFTSLDSEPMLKPEARLVTAKTGSGVYNGFTLTSDRVLPDGTKHITFSDGMNRFSVFRRDVNTTEPIEQKRILYGNYVYRKRVDKELFTVVGTIPFTEMERFVNNIVKLEEKKK